MQLIRLFHRVDTRRPKTPERRSVDGARVAGDAHPQSLAEHRARRAFARSDAWMQNLSTASEDDRGASV